MSADSGRNRTGKAGRMDGEPAITAGEELLEALLLRGLHDHAALHVTALREETLPRRHAPQTAQHATHAVLGSALQGLTGAFHCDDAATGRVEGLLESLHNTARAITALDERRRRLSHLDALVQTQRDAPEEIRTALRWNPLALGRMACGQHPGWLFDRTHPDKDNPANWAALCFEHWAHYHHWTEQAEQAGYMIPVDLHDEDGPQGHSIEFRGTRARITEKGELVI